MTLFQLNLALLTLTVVLVSIMMSCVSYSITQVKKRLAKEKEEQNVIRSSSYKESI